MRAKILELSDANKREMLKGYRQQQATQPAQVQAGTAGGSSGRRGLGGGADGAEDAPPLPPMRTRSVSASPPPLEGAAPLAVTRQRSTSAFAPTPQPHSPTPPQGGQPPRAGQRLASGGALHGEPLRSAGDNGSSCLPMLAQQLSQHWETLVTGDGGMEAEERVALTEMIRQAKARGDRRLARGLQAELDKDDPLAQMIAAAKAQRDRALLAKLRADRDGGGVAAERKPSRVRQGSVVLLRGTAHLAKGAVEQVGAAVTSAAALRPPADLRATMRATMRTPRAAANNGETAEAGAGFGASFVSPRGQSSKPRPRLGTVNGTRGRELSPRAGAAGGGSPAAVEEAVEEGGQPPGSGSPEADISEAEIQQDGGLYRACSALGDALLLQAEKDSSTDRQAAVGSLAAAMSAMMHSEAIASWERGEVDAAATKIKEALVFDEHDQVALALAARFAAALPADNGGLAAGWEEQLDDEGSVYYYNTYSGVSQWEVPQEVAGATEDPPDLPAGGTGGRRLPLGSLSLPSAEAVRSAGARMTADVGAAISRPISRPFGRLARGAAADAQESARPGSAASMPADDAPRRLSAAATLSPAATPGDNTSRGGALVPLPRVTELRSSVEDASSRRSASVHPDHPADLRVPTLSAEDRDSISRLQQLEQRLSTVPASGPRSRSASKDGEAQAPRAIGRSRSTLAEMLRLAKERGDRPLAKGLQTELDRDTGERVSGRKLSRVRQGSTALVAADLWAGLVAKGGEETAGGTAAARAVAQTAEGSAAAVVVDALDSPLCASSLRDSGASLGTALGSSYTAEL